MITKLAAVGLLGCGLCLAQSPEQEYKAAVQAQLVSEKPACVALFDTSDPTGHLLLKGSRTGGSTQKLDAFYEHGLVVREDTRVSFDHVSGFVMARHKNAWRYDWAPAVAANVVNDELCYGFSPVVDSVVRWAETDPGRSLNVVYTWHYTRVGDWAKQGWVKNAEPTAFAAATETELTGTKTLTRYNDGWH